MEMDYSESVLKNFPGKPKQVPEKRESIQLFCEENKPKQNKALAIRYLY